MNDIAPSLYIVWPYFQKIGVLKESENKYGISPKLIIKLKNSI